MTLSHVKGASDQPLIEKTIGVVFDEVSDAHSDVCALVSRHQDIRLSYAELRDNVDRLAVGLMRLGLSRGDRVGIWSPNCAEWVYAQFATAKLGLILVNVNPAYRSFELDYAVNKVGMRAIIAAAQFKTSDYVTMLAELRSAKKVATLEHIIILDDDAVAPGMIAFRDVMVAPNADDLATLAHINATLSPDDVINIQFTSGTTGAPKGASLTHRNILNNGFFVVEALGLGVGDAICLPVPLYHCFGMVMGNLGLLTHAGTMVFPAASFDPVATLQAIAQEGCVGLYAVPTMFIAMLDAMDAGDYNLSLLRTGIMAGSPCPIEIMRRVIDEMNCSGISIAYGMTETSPVSFQTGRNDPIERRVSTVGQIQPHAEVKIIQPETGKVVARGETGELCTRGYLVMRGYWEDQDLTDQAIDDQGFMHTGDLAVMDDAGYVNIVGRSKDMVIRGGENIYPREVEEFLYSHPGISDVQVVGLPDAQFGEVLCAVVIRSDPSLTADAVKAFCKDQIAHFKIPAYVEFVDDFPMTVTGKIQKYLLRDRIASKHGLTTRASA